MSRGGSRVWSKVGPVSGLVLGWVQGLIISKVQDLVIPEVGPGCGLSKGGCSIWHVWGLGAASGHGQREGGEDDSNGEETSSLKQQTSMALPKRKIRCGRGERAPPPWFHPWMCTTEHCCESQRFFFLLSLIVDIVLSHSDLPVSSEAPLSSQVAEAGSSPGTSRVVLILLVVSHSNQSQHQTLNFFTPCKEWTLD